MRAAGGGGALAAGDISSLTSCKRPDIGKYPISVYCDIANTLGTMSSVHDMYTISDPISCTYTRYRARKHDIGHDIKNIGYGNLLYVHDMYTISGQILPISGPIPSIFARYRDLMT